MGLFTFFARVTESPGGTSKYPRKCSECCGGIKCQKRPTKYQESPNTNRRTFGTCAIAHSARSSQKPVPWYIYYIKSQYIILSRRASAGHCTGYATNLSGRTWQD